MDSELPAFLLARKLRGLKTLLGDENYACRGLRDKISHVVDKFLEPIAARTGNWDRQDDSRQQEVVREISSIRDLDDITDRFLLRRARWSDNGLVRGMERFEKEIMWMLPTAAISAAPMSSSPEPLSHIQHQVDWESIRHPELMATQAEAQYIMFPKLVYSGAGRAEGDKPVFILQGRRGTGKTTLMRYLYDQVDITRDYPCRAWVSINEKLTYKDVLLELIEQIGQNGVVIDHVKAEDKLVQELFILLRGVDRCLIVLDDCTSKIWPKLMECLPEKAGESRLVLVITTPEPIEEFMKNRGNILPDTPGFVTVVQLNELRTAAQWEFLGKLIKEEPAPGTVEQLEGHIDRSIRASVLLAGALNTQRQDDIPRAVNAIKVYVERPSVQRLSVEVTLKWSYHDLHPLVKVCFLFLSIFPKGNEVPLRRLRYLWLSEGFLDDNDGHHSNQEFPSPRQVAETCLKILINRKLVEVTRWKLDRTPKTCRIPIFVHDFATETLRSTSLFNLYNQPGSGGAWDVEGSNVRRLASHAEIKIPRTSVHQRLRTYVSFHNKTGGKLNAEINDHLKTLTQKRSYILLKLLDLEGVYKPELPDSIGNLLYLRYLGLRSTQLDYLPTSTGKLQCLETMDLKCTNVIGLPNSLLRSGRLRHLHAKQVPLDDFMTTSTCRYHCLIPCACPRRQQSSSNLLTLTGLHIGNGKSLTWRSHPLANLQKLEVTCDIHNPRTQASSIDIGKFISGMAELQSLKLKCTDSTHHYSLDLSRHRNLKKVYLCCKLEPGGDGDEDQQPAHGNVLPRPLENRLPLRLGELTLSKSRLRMDPMKVLGDLPSLVVLRLLSDSYLGDQMELRDGSFISLRVLKLWKLPELARLTVQRRSMSRLKEMEIRKCDKMRQLVGSENLPTTIDVLVLCDMPKEFLRDVQRHQIIQKTTIVETSKENHDEEQERGE